MFLRHQLRVETRSMDDFGCVTNYGLKSVAWFAFDCVVKPCIHATGFSQWLMTKLSERRIYSALRVRQEPYLPKLFARLFHFRKRGRAVKIEIATNGKATTQSSSAAREIKLRHSQ